MCHKDSAVSMQIPGDSTTKHLKNSRSSWSAEKDGAQSNEVKKPLPCNCTTSSVDPTVSEWEIQTILARHKQIRAAQEASRVRWPHQSQREPTCHQRCNRREIFFPSMSVSVLHCHNVTAIICYTQPVTSFYSRETQAVPAAGLLANRSSATNTPQALQRLRWLALTNHNSGGIRDIKRYLESLQCCIFKVEIPTTLSYGQPSGFHTFHTCRKLSLLWYNVTLEAMSCIFFKENNLFLAVANSSHEYMNSLTSKAKGNTSISLGCEALTLKTLEGKDGPVSKRYGGHTKSERTLRI